MAFNTPFKMFKRYNYEGGVADPMVIHWPKGIKAKGEVRHQYHHAIDIVPTIYECVGSGVPRGASRATSRSRSRAAASIPFESGDAPTPKEPVLRDARHAGDLAQRLEGRHRPPDVAGWGHFDEDRWELYHTEVDRTEAHDLAAQDPEKLKELIAAGSRKPDKFNGLPLDDRLRSRSSTIRRPQLAPPRDRYVYYPDTAEVPEAVAVNVRGRSFRIAAEVTSARRRRAVCSSLTALGSAATRCS